MNTTPLTVRHQQMGAKMAPFAGYLMPIQYSSISNEHLAVRQGVGMFDVSHMGEFCFEGPGALDFLQAITPNDVSKLKVGRAHYSMLPNLEGGLVDDIYIYHTAEGQYLMVVNASNIEKDWNHIVGLMAGFDVVLRDDSATTSLIAVQGPKALETLQALVDADLSATKKNDTFECRLEGKTVRLARTGYTGEDGFELFCANADALPIWNLLLGAGVLPCGLGARDTLRLEAGFPLYGHEFSDETSPLATPFAWVVKAYKGFHGKEAMMNKPVMQKLVGMVLEQGIPREGYPVLHRGKVVGKVTSGTISPLTKKGIAFAYVASELAQVGRAIEVEIRGKAHSGVMVDPPFR